MPYTEKQLMVRVCCDAAKSEMAPQRFFIGTRKVEVLEVIDRWLAPDYGYFKVYGDDDGTYILKHDVVAGDWELTLYDSGQQHTSQLRSSTVKVHI